MKLYEYLSKDEQLQFQIIWDSGVHIDTVSISGNTYLLYAINDFYVEVIYNQNKIIGKNQFKQGEPLEKYLPKIKPR